MTNFSANSRRRLGFERLEVKAAPATLAPLDVTSASDSDPFAERGGPLVEARAVDVRSEDLLQFVRQQVPVSISHVARPVASRDATRTDRIMLEHATWSGPHEASCGGPRPAAHDMPAEFQLGASPGAERTNL